MLQLKINKISLEESPWAMQWTPRESEVMSNQVIGAEVRKQMEECAKALQNYLQDDVAPPQRNQQQYVPRGNQNYQYSQNQQSPQGYQQYGNNAQRYQPWQGNQYNQNNQQGQYIQPAIGGLACWGCDKIGHSKNNCPTINGFVDNGWCFFDDRMTLNWDIPSQPQGRIANLGNRLWAETIASEIKRRWLKRDVDPLTVKSDWLSSQKPPTSIENNAISVRLMPDDTGAVSNDACARFGMFPAYWQMTIWKTEHLSGASVTLLLQPQPALEMRARVLRDQLRDRQTFRGHPRQS
jgi:hypothetical protein